MDFGQALEFLPGPVQINTIQCRPLILSLSKDARSSRSWFDKLTMSGSEWTLDSPRHP